MRIARLLAAALLVLGAGSVAAQGWKEYVSRDEFFMVQFPGMPRIERIDYRDDAGTMLPARLFTATENQKIYTVTVVQYPNADAATGERAMAQALNALRNAGGRVTLDARMDGDGYPGHSLYVTNPDGSRTASGVHWNDGRLYILSGRAPANMPPPIQFHQSLYVLDGNGHRVSYQTRNGQRTRLLDCAFCPDSGAVAGGEQPPRVIPREQQQ